MLGIPDKRAYSGGINRGVLAAAFRGELSHCSGNSGFLTLLDARRDSAIHTRRTHGHNFSRPIQYTPHSVFLHLNWSPRQKIICVQCVRWTSVINPTLSQRKVFIYMKLCWWYFFDNSSHFWVNISTLLLLLINMLSIHMRSFQVVCLHVWLVALVFNFFE